MARAETAPRREQLAPNKQLLVVYGDHLIGTANLAAQNQLHQLVVATKLFPPIHAWPGDTQKEIYQLQPGILTLDGDSFEYPFQSTSIYSSNKEFTWYIQPGNPFTNRPPNADSFLVSADIAYGSLVWYKKNAHLNDSDFITEAQKQFPEYTQVPDFNKKMLTRRYIYKAATTYYESKMGLPIESDPNVLSPRDQKRADIDNQIITSASVGVFAEGLIDIFLADLIFESGRRAAERLAANPYSTRRRFLRGSRNVGKVLVGLDVGRLLTGSVLANTNGVDSLKNKPILQPINSIVNNNINQYQDFPSPEVIEYLNLRDSLIMLKAHEAQEQQIPLSQQSSNPMVAVLGTGHKYAKDLFNNLSDALDSVKLSFIQLYQLIDADYSANPNPDITKDDIIRELGEFYGGANIEKVKAGPGSLTQDGIFNNISYVSTFLSQAVQQIAVVAALESNFT